MRTETGQLADTFVATLFHGSDSPKTIHELSFYNSGSVICIVRTYWNGVEDAYVKLGANERSVVYEGLTVGSTDSIRAQADLPATINYKVNVS